MFENNFFILLQSFQYINSTQFPLYVSVIILLFALTLWLFFRFKRLNPINKQLDKILIIFKESPAEFSVETLDKLDAQIQQLDGINHYWQLFLNQEKHMGCLPVYSSHHFFNTKTLVHTQINVRFYQSVPNLFIQIGMLLTFLGLLAALYAAGHGLISDDLLVVREALQNLLIAATFKFSTSLSGMLAAIIFSWREKYHWYVLQTKIDKLNHYLDVFMLPVAQSVPIKEENEDIQVQTTMDSPLVETNATQTIASPFTEHSLHTMEAALNKISSFTDEQIEQLEEQKLNKHHSHEFSSHDEIHQSTDQFNNNLIVAVNLGFNSIKKEVQRLNSSLGVSTQRLYGAITKVAGNPIKQARETSIAKASTTSPSFHSSSASAQEDTKHEKNKDSKLLEHRHDNVPLSKETIESSLRSSAVIDDNNKSKDS